MKLKEQRCSNCNAYLAQAGDQGVCRPSGPQTHVTGKERMQLPQGLIRGGGPQVAEQPTFSSVFAPVMAHGWCRSWEPKGWNHWMGCFDDDAELRERARQQKLSMIETAELERQLLHAEGELDS